MSAVHTPGPWGISSRHESHGDHSTVRRFLKIPGSDYIEVSMLTDPSPEQDSVARANVRLLAAAPDLLNAAETLLAELHARIDTAPANAVPVFIGIAALSDAINKARGRS